MSKIASTANRQALVALIGVLGFMGTISVKAQITVNLNASGNTMIDSYYNTQNFVTWGAVLVGSNDSGAEVERGLFTFDLSGIPTNATVTSATLKLAFTGNNVGTADTLSFYRMNTAWTSAGATWNTTNGSTPWTAPGAASNASATASFSASGTFAGSNSSAVYFNFTGTGLVSDVQNWVNHSVTNYGWLLRDNVENDSNGKQYFTSAAEGSGAETGYFAAQPVLQVTYTVPPVQYSQNFSTSVGNWTSSDGIWHWNSSVGNPAGCFLTEDNGGPSILTTTDQVVVSSSGHRTITASFDTFNGYGQYSSMYYGSFTVQFTDGTTVQRYIPCIYPTNVWQTSSATYYEAKDIALISNIQIIFFHSVVTGYHWDAIDNVNITVSSDPGRSTWDASADFSALANPNGAWSYGYISPALVATAYTTKGTVSMGGGISPSGRYGGWYANISGNQTPNVGQSAPGVNVYEGGLLLASNKLQLFGYTSGSNVYQPYVEWTCPSTGVYNFSWNFDNSSTSGTWNEQVVAEIPASGAYWSKNLYYNSGSDNDAAGGSAWNNIYLTSGTQVFFILTPNGTSGGGSCELSATIGKSTAGSIVTGNQWVRSHPFTLSSWTGFSSLNVSQYEGAGLNSILCGESVPSVFTTAKANGITPHAYLNGTSLTAIETYVNTVSTTSDTNAWYILDEPPLDGSAFSSIASVASWLRANRPYALNYCNLFASGLIDDWTYLAPYWTQCQPEALMYDFYPFTSTTTSWSIDYTDYFMYMCKARSFSECWNVPYFSWMQTYREPADPNNQSFPTESELRMQMFSSLTAGFKGLGSFSYDSNTDIQGGFLNLDGSLGPMYGFVATVNGEISKLGGPLRFLTNTGIYFIPGWNGTGWNPGYSSVALYNWSEYAPGGNPHITNIQPDTSIVMPNNNGLIGFFTDDNGRNYFMLTNICCSGDSSQSPDSLTMIYTVTFDSSINCVYRINRKSGLQERIVLTSHTLVVSLPGGTGDLFSIQGF